MKKMMKKLKKAAKKGRHGDTELVHMRRDEVDGLGLLAEATGKKLTKNPDTGLPEAFSLPSWVLPAAAIAATVATGGAAAPLAAGAAGGGAAAGGAAAGGLLAAEAAATAAPALAGAAAPLAAEGAALAAPAAGLLESQAAAPFVEQGASAGLLDKANFMTGNMASPGGLLETAGQYAKPVGIGMQAAQMFTPPPKQDMPMAAPQITPPANDGPAKLQQLVSQGQQNSMAQQQNQMAQRAKRQQMIARMNGMNRG